MGATMRPSGNTSSFRLGEWVADPASNLILRDQQEVGATDDDSAGLLGRPVRQRSQSYRVGVRSLAQHGGQL